MLITDLCTLSNLSLQNTLTAITTIINSHHPLVTLLSIEQLWYHDVTLFCWIIGEWVGSYNLTAVYVPIYIGQDNMIVASTSSVIIRVSSIVWLQTFPFRLDHQILLLVNVCHSLIVFCLFIQLLG